MTTPADLLSVFQDIDSRRYGTKFYKVDLHFHTPASSDARGANKYGYNPYRIPYPAGTAAATLRNEEITIRINTLLEEIKANKDIKELKDIKDLPELQLLEGDYPVTERDFQYRLLFYARIKAAQIIERFREEGLSLVAITDHNGIGTIWPDARGRMDLAAPTWYEIIADEADKVNRKLGTRITVLPGTEISTSGVHILAIFPPQEPRRKVHFMICDLLAEVGIAPDQWGENAAVGTTSPYDTVELISRKGGLAIPSHIDGADQGLLGLYKLTGGALKRTVTHPNLRGVEVVDSSKFVEEAVSQDGKTRTSLKVQLEETRREAGLSSLAYTQGSDAHDLKDIGKRFTFLKMTEPSHKGLETALKMASSRVRIADSRKEWNGLYIHGISFKDEPNLGRQSLRFNRNLNCIVGKIDVGKTSLFRLMKAAVDLEDPGRPVTACQGNVILFVDQIKKQETDLSGTGTNEPERYVYRRAAAEDWASLEALDQDGKPTGRKIGLKEAKDCSLQPKFYDAEKMKNIISDEQEGPETLQGFLCKYFGEPVDTDTATRVVEEFNELFFLPSFLDREKRSQVVDRINELKKDATKNKSAISRNIAKLQDNQLLTLAFDPSGSYRLQMNLEWRRDSEPVDFFQLTSSQRKTAMICMLLLKGESPVIIAAPEDEFDNEDMVKYLVPVILESKDSRQILLFTNHPILAVNTDPDNYILIPPDAGKSAIISGFAIDTVVEKDEKGNPKKGDRKTLLLEILEGDLNAFRKRASRYE